MHNKNTLTDPDISFASVRTLLPSPDGYERCCVSATMTHGVGIHLLGPDDITIKESLLRVTTALNSLGYRIPGKKIILEIMPENGRKVRWGSSIDLPLAVVILAASGQAYGLSGSMSACIVGELSLDAKVRTPLTASSGIIDGMSSVTILPEGLMNGENRQAVCVRTLEQTLDAIRDNLSTPSGCENVERAVQIAYAGGFGLLVLQKEGRKILGEIASSIPAHTVESKETYRLLKRSVGDRFAVQVYANMIPANRLFSPDIRSAAIRNARRRQQERFEGMVCTEPMLNADMDRNDIARLCPLSQECLRLVEMLVERLGMHDSYYHVVRIARTIADLDDCVDIHQRHIAEAVAFRFLDVN